MTDPTQDHKRVSPPAQTQPQQESAAWPEHEFIQWGSKRYGPLLRASIDLLAEVENNLDTKDAPQKFGVPFGKLVALRAAIEASPPARKPLTDEEIAELYMSHTDRPMKAHWEFARAIEAAHGIKEDRNEA